MNDENEMEMMNKIINTQFEDTRIITKKADSNIQKIAEKYEIEATIYETNTHELISYGIQDKDLTNQELETYTQYGEDLFNLSEKIVSIYLTGLPHIKNRAKSELISPAIIMIKLLIMPYSQAYDVLREIKRRVENKNKLNSDDLFALSMIPLLGPPEDKRNLRIECLKLWKEINKKKMIQ